MKLPSAIRAAGALRLKLALGPPMSFAPNPIKPAAPINKLPQPVKPPAAMAPMAVKPPAPVSMPGAPPAMSTAMPAAPPKMPGTGTGAMGGAGMGKKADALEATGKLVSLVADDGLSLLARKLLQGGQQAARVPAMVEKYKSIEDPEYMPSSTYSVAAKTLGQLGKLANLQTNLASSPETSMKWEMDKRRIGAAFDLNGPAFRNDPPSESTNVGTGDSVKEGTLVGLDTQVQPNLMENIRSIANGVPVTAMPDRKQAIGRQFEGMRVFENDDSAATNAVGGSPLSQ